MSRLEGFEEIKSEDLGDELPMSLVEWEVSPSSTLALGPLTSLRWGPFSAPTLVDHFTLMCVHSQQPESSSPHQTVALRLVEDFLKSTRYL